jgi:D-3-phosphoglycerate dehydrogenase
MISRPHRGRVVVLDGRSHPYHDFEIEHRLWESHGIETVLGDCRTESDIITAAADAEAIVFWGLDLPVTQAVVEQLKRCRLIARYGLGFDSVNVEAATSNGIVVAVPAQYCVSEVAEHAAALIFALARRLPFLDRETQAGGWRRSGPLTAGVQRLSTQTLGLIGFGRTARRLAEIIRPTVESIIAHDPYVDQAEADGYGVQLVPLDRLAAESDFLSIHIPLTAETRSLVGAGFLGLLKPTAFLINTSRGAIVDEQALAAALRDDRLAGAGLDVFETEPLPAHSELRSLHNVVLTPHFAGNSEHAKVDLYLAMAEMVTDVLEGRWPRHTVNPEVHPRIPLRDRSQ